MGFMSGLGVDRVGRHRLRACTAAALVALAAACSSASSRGNARASTAENSSGPAPGAQGRYSLRSLHRTYGFSASGTILPPAVPSPTPAVAVGLMTFDGRGGCTIADTINIGGTVAVREATACT